MVKKEEKTVDNGDELQSVHLKLPPGLIKKIDQYKVDNYLGSRNSSIIELLRVGLGELERKK